MRLRKGREEERASEWGGKVGSGTNGTRWMQVARLVADFCCVSNMVVDGVRSEAMLREGGIFVAK
jgi:hypothetical protein